MANFETEAKFTEQMRKFETSDKAHADLFNGIIGALLNNDVFLRSVANQLLLQLQQHISDSQTALDSYYQQSSGYTDQKIANLIGGAPTTLDTLGEIAKAMQDNESVVAALDAAIGKKAGAAEFDSHVKDKTNPHKVTATQVKAVSTDASQGLSEAQKANARENIGALAASAGDKIGIFDKFTYYDIAKFPTLKSATTGFYVIPPNDSLAISDMPSGAVGNRSYLLKSRISDEEFMLVISPRRRTTWINYLYGTNWSGWESISDGGNADTLGGFHASAFAQQFHYGTTLTHAGGYYKIKIKSSIGWMLSCMIMLYQGYRSYTIVVSGYNYGDRHWFKPYAEIVSASEGVNSIEVKFGYDADGLLWFAIPAGHYTGLTICNINNGYNQVADWANQLEYTYGETLSGTIQTSVAATAPTKSLSVRNIEFVSSLPSDAASHPDTLYIIPE